jgi:hypothetical protein
VVVCGSSLGNTAPSWRLTPIICRDRACLALAPKTSSRLDGDAGTLFLYQTRVSLTSRSVNAASCSSSLFWSTLLGNSSTPSEGLSKTAIIWIQTPGYLTGTQILYLHNTKTLQRPSYSNNICTLRQASNFREDIDMNPEVKIFPLILYRSCYTST